MNSKITKVSLETLKIMKGNTHWAKLIAEEKEADKPPRTTTKKKSK